MTSDASSINNCWTVTPECDVPGLIHSPVIPDSDGNGIRMSCKRFVPFAKGFRPDGQIFTASVVTDKPVRLMTVKLTGYDPENPVTLIMVRGFRQFSSPQQQKEKVDCPNQGDGYFSCRDQICGFCGEKRNALGVHPQAGQYSKWLDTMVTDGDTATDRVSGGAKTVTLLRRAEPNHKDVAFFAVEPGARFIAHPFDPRSPVLLITTAEDGNSVSSSYVMPTVKIDGLGKLQYYLPRMQMNEGISEGHFDGYVCRGIGGKSLYFRLELDPDLFHFDTSRFSSEQVTYDKVGKVLSQSNWPKHPEHEMEGHKTQLPPDAMQALQTLQRKFSGARWSYNLEYATGVVYVEFKEPYTQQEFPKISKLGGMITNNLKG